LYETKKKPLIDEYGKPYSLALPNISDGGARRMDSTTGNVFGPCPIPYSHFHRDMLGDPTVNLRNWK